MPSFRLFPAVFLVCVAAIAAARAQTAYVLPAYVEGVSENDLYSSLVENDDRWYTNGLRLEYGLGSRDPAPPILGRWPVRFADRLCGAGCAPRNGESAIDTIGYALVSNTYTPTDTQLIAPDPRDRPYAGVLFVSQLYDRASVREGRIAAERRLSIDLGVIGPASGAGEIQRWWHRRIGAAVPRGWGAQIGDEPIVQLGWREERRVARFGEIAELWAQGRADLGTLRVMAAAGGQARFGWLGSRLDAREAQAPWISAAYANVGVEARLVGWNATIDGGVFTGGSSVSSRPFLAQWSFGAVVEVKERVRITYDYFERTKEFRGPLGKRYGYGSIAVRWVLPLP
jgi:hypothetical protein